MAKRKLAGLAVTLAAVAALLLGYRTQARDSNMAGAGYSPRLGDLMTTMQIRHMKLWFAGRSKNWDLAAYEIDKMRESFQDIAMLYPGIPLADMASMAKPTQDVSAAVMAKDSAKFIRTFADMTETCNACHRAIGRGFIAIQVPTASPFSNQLFLPASRK